MVWFLSPSVGSPQDSRRILERSLGRVRLWMVALHCPFTPFLIQVPLTRFNLSLCALFLQTLTPSVQLTRQPLRRTPKRTIKETESWVFFWLLEASEIGSFCYLELLHLLCYFKSKRLVQALISFRSLASLTMATLSFLSCLSTWTLAILIQSCCLTPPSMFPGALVSWDCHSSN